MAFNTIMEDMVFDCAVPPEDAADAADDNSPSYDQLDGSYLEGRILLQTGAATGSPTAQDVTITLEDSADDTTFAAIAAITVSSTADDEEVSIRFKPGDYRRYIRINRTVTFTGGSTPTIPCSAVMLLGSAGRS